MSQPLTWPVEAKVIASSAATALVSVVIAVLNALQNNPSLLGSLPTLVQSLVIVVVPTLITFISGYLAKHTYRSGGSV